MADNGFIVYGDIEEVLNELSDEQVATLFRGMVQYHNTGNTNVFDGILKFVWIPIKQQMDRNTEKYEKKCKKNKENIQKYWSEVKGVENERIREDFQNTNATNTKTDTDTDTKTDTDTDTKSPQSVDVTSLSLSVISQLNSLAGTNYDPGDIDTVRMISELAAKGYSEGQMIRVITRKCDEWLGDPKMEGYLRPSTLFKPSNFAKYLNAPDTARQEAKAKERRAQENKASAEVRLKEVRSALNQVATKLAELKVKENPEDFEKRKRLKDREAILFSERKRLEAILND